jgi:hypothetical protein
MMPDKAAGTWMETDMHHTPPALAVGTMHQSPPQLAISPLTAMCAINTTSPYMICLGNAHNSQQGGSEQYFGEFHFHDKYLSLKRPLLERNALYRTHLSKIRLTC